MSEKRSPGEVLKSRLVPSGYLARQLRKPTGRFGRWVMLPSLNKANADLIKATMQVLALSGTECFLDVGFGGGSAIRQAATETSGDLWGADFSADAVAGAHKRLLDLVQLGRLNVLRADACDLPLRSNMIDAATTINTLYFLPSLKAAFTETARVLKPGGRFVIGYTGQEKMKDFSNIAQHGFKTVTEVEVEASLRECGFVDVETKVLLGKVTSGDFVTSARVKG